MKHFLKGFFVFIAFFIGLIALTATLLFSLAIPYIGFPIFILALATYYGYENYRLSKESIKMPRMTPRRPPVRGGGGWFW